MILKLTIREIDNEVWGTCTFEKFPFNENASSIKEVEAKLRKAIKKLYPQTKVDELQFELQH